MVRTRRSELNARHSHFIPWVVFAVVACAWLFVSLTVLSPEFGSGDVYLFRDAAINFLTGHGFRTFAVERQTSFDPQFYSSYTPGLQWLYIAFGSLAGASARAETIFKFLSVAILDAIFFSIGLRLARGRRLRIVFFALLALLFPSAGLAIMPERPEYVSLILLTAILAVLSSRITWGKAVLLASLSVGAFLAEPIAGVYALFFVVGSWFVAATARDETAPRVRSFPTAMMAACVVLFFAALSAVAMNYLRMDPQSLHRFSDQSAQGGFHRTAESRQGDFAWPPLPADAPAPARNPHHGRFWDIVVSTTASKPILLESAGYLLCGLFAAVMISRSTGPSASRFALFALTLACLVMPLVVFPLQANYRFMAVALMAIALAFDWAGIRTISGIEPAPVILLVITFVACVPDALLGYAIRLENRPSYDLALKQAESFRSYLLQHPPAANGVFIVPDSHYHLYKSVLGSMTTPRYLSSREDPSRIAGVVNCYAGTLFYGSTELPIPELAVNQPLHRLVSKDTDVRVTLFPFKQKANQTWQCDVDVR